MLLGRGNQQLSPEFLTQLSLQQWLIVSTKDKLQGLANRPLLLDSNDLELDKQLSGFYPIVVGFNEQVLYAAACNYATDTL
jgi:predicted polyphosphate/ATP-dependent NAD kinase